MQAARKSATVVIRNLGILRGICDDAVADRLIQANPCDGAETLRKRHRKRTYLTAGQLFRLASESGGRGTAPVVTVVAMMAPYLLVRRALMHGILVDFRQEVGCARRLRRVRLAGLATHARATLSGLYERLECLRGFGEFVLAVRVDDAEHVDGDAGLAR